MSPNPRSMLRLAGNLPFELFSIDHLIDMDRRYQLKLNPRFPLAVKLFSFPQEKTFPLNWHERLELFIAVEGKGGFRMGNRTVHFAAGDMLVVDVRSLHGLVDLRAPETRGIVISFMPELVCTLASPDCDSQYLTPFFCQSDTTDPALRRGDPYSAPVHAALRKLVACYFNPGPDRQFEAGCKAYLLEILYLLSLHFGFSPEAQAVYMQRRRLAERLRTLQSWLADHYAEKISVSDAASLCAMSESKFMKAFKKATGSTFVNYVTQIRLSQSLHMLRQGDAPISEIAARVGFSDQSYFDRRFKERFLQTPIEYRRGGTRTH